MSEQTLQPELLPVLVKLLPVLVSQVPVLVLDAAEEAAERQECFSWAPQHLVLVRVLVRAVAGAGKQECFS